VAVLLKCTNEECFVCLQVLRQCPGMISAYVELARCYAALGMFDEAGRVLQQCLSLQPHCSPVLVAVRCFRRVFYNVVTSWGFLAEVVSTLGTTVLAMKLLCGWLMSERTL
jgi:hypothetical protein